MIVQQYHQYLVGRPWQVPIMAPSITFQLKPMLWLDGKIKLNIDNCAPSNMSAIATKLFASWLRGRKIELGILIVKDWKRIPNMSAWNTGSLRNDWIILPIVFVADSKLYIPYE